MLISGQQIVKGIKKYHQLLEATSQFCFTKIKKFLKKNIKKFQNCEYKNL